MPRGCSMAFHPIPFLTCCWQPEFMRICGARQRRASSSQAYRSSSSTKRPPTASIILRGQLSLRTELYLHPADVPFRPRRRACSGSLFVRFGCATVTHFLVNFSCMQRSVGMYARYRWSSKRIKSEAGVSIKFQQFSRPHNHSTSTKRTKPFAPDPEGPLHSRGIPSFALLSFQRLPFALTLRLYFPYARLPTVDEWVSLYPYNWLYISPHR